MVHSLILLKQSCTDISSREIEHTLNSFHVVHTWLFLIASKSAVSRVKVFNILHVDSAWQQGLYASPRIPEVSRDGDESGKYFMPGEG